MLSSHVSWLVALAASINAPAPAAESAKAVIEKAIEATGGAATLSKYSAGRMEFKGTLDAMGLEVTFTGKTTYLIPDCERNEMKLNVGGMEINMTQIVNSKKVKTVVNGEDGPGVSDAMQEEMHEGAKLTEVYQLTPLLDAKKFEVKVIDNPAKVDDKETMAIAVTAKGLKEAKLFFDKKTGLLVKVEREGLSPGNEEKGKQELYFRDYKKFGGVMTPTKWEMHHDGKKVMNMEFSNVEYLEKVDAKEFDISD